MFDSINNIFKVKEIRMKLFFTFLMLIVIRFGCQLPVPGVDRNYFAEWFAQQTGDAFSFVDAFTGGALPEDWVSYICGETLAAVGEVPTPDATVTVEGEGKENIIIAIVKQ